MRYRCLVLSLALALIVPAAVRAQFTYNPGSGYGYNQPASAYAAVGVIAAATGDSASKYVARRETPLYIPENCTQCMECISVCPDTALPNCSQDLGTMLSTAVSHYVGDPAERSKMLAKLPEIEKQARARMVAARPRRLTWSSRHCPASGSPAPSPSPAGAAGGSPARSPN